MNIGRPLLIGVDDDLVDQLDEFVVSSRGNLVTTVAFDFPLVHRREQIPHIGVIAEAATEELIHRLPELAYRCDSIGNLVAWKDVIDDTRAFELLRIERQDDDAFPAILDRQPLVLFNILAAQILHQVDRLDAIRLERLVRHPEELGERRADHR